MRLVAATAVLLLVATLAWAGGTRVVGQSARVPRGGSVATSAEPTSLPACTIPATIPCEVQ